MRRTQIQQRADVSHLPRQTCPHRQHHFCAVVIVNWRHWWASKRLGLSESSPNPGAGNPGRMRGIPGNKALWRRRWITAIKCRQHYRHRSPALGRGPSQSCGNYRQWGQRSGLPHFVADGEAKDGTDRPEPRRKGLDNAWQELSCPPALSLDSPTV